MLEVFVVAVRRQLPLPAVEVEVAVGEISALDSGVPVMAMLERDEEVFWVVLDYRDVSG